MFEGMIVTAVYSPITVTHKQGAVVHMVDRKTYGISFCSSGKLTYTIDGVCHTQTPDTAILLPKGRSYTIHSKKCGSYPVINFDAQGWDCNTIKVIKLSNNAPYLKYAERLQKQFLFRENSLKIHSIFYDLLNRLTMEAMPKNYRLSQMVAYLEEHIADPTITNTSLAKHFNISEVYLRKLFADTYHTSPKQYILEIRLNQAKQLLSENHYSVAGISEMCGFSGIYHFCRIFKSKFGCTPTEYRKSNTFKDI